MPHDRNIDDTAEQAGEWGQQRARLRHEVAVPAQILGSKGPPIDCEIRDISAAGMFLHYHVLIPAGAVEPLRVGSTVQVKFEHVSPDGTSAVVRFQAEIMRKQPHGIGIKLLGLSKELREVLSAIATAAVAARSAGAESSPDASRAGVPAREAKKILRDCRKAIERHLPHIMWTLRTETTSRLRADGDVKRKSGGNADADLLERKAGAIARTIERRVLLGFAEVGGLQNTQELVFTQPVHEAPAGQERARADMETLSDGAVEDSAALLAVIQRVDNQLKGRSFDVNLRLASVVGQRVDTDDNPLVPAVMCRILWESMIQFCDTARVRAGLRELIPGRVTPLMAKLYDDLSDVLDKHQVARAFEER